MIVIYGLLFVGWDDFEGKMIGCKWWFVGKMKVWVGCIKGENWFYLGEIR